MRRPVEKERLRKFMQDFGAEADQPTRVYLTGGATAVLLGWRASTIDVDLEMVPENDKLLRSIPRLKESLELNIELASPAHFIPEVPGWEGRSQFIQRDGLVSFFHYDFYAQALAKIERGHSQDVADVKQMLTTVGQAGPLEGTVRGDLPEPVSLACDRPEGVSQRLGSHSQ
jgi:hypothetical protein